jgi:3-methyladenine DNA glycosylase Tag
MARDHRRKITYYDTDCGGPLYDVRRFFEFLILEGAQAALSGIALGGRG